MDPQETAEKMKIGAGIVPAFLLCGVAGWALENMIRGPTYSKAFGGAKVPFLPVYAFGGAAVIIVGSKIQHIAGWQRFLIYGGTTTLVEAVAGVLDRADGSKPSWDYDGSPVDLKYSLLWAAGAMAIEAAAISMIKK